MTSPHVQAAKRIYYQAFGHSKPLPFWVLQLNALRPNVQFWALLENDELRGWLYLLLGAVQLYFCVRQLKNLEKAAREDAQKTNESPKEE